MITHWLRMAPAPCVCWASFECHGETATVLALIGATRSIIERGISAEEARAIYRRLRADGWFAADAQARDEKMTPSRLLTMIRD